ncbi:outer membrane beta-barrel protein [Nonlabens ulvanivorans]|uniref:outer membrane beta-barrel protein n=1 Tax=Nonlabens ulvanivorans TaxID=906888 RepID=UPI00294393BC|nr:outer membrane beta-barrel protein [Nonlabens ulvanivorans]WOI22295.1 outer membrane beta-barrel protein [Nonlabens ulvanivorans]
MSDKKNIDRLFQERFKDFEAAPPMAAWDNIEKKLDGKKPVAVFPLWIKWIGIAAGIALLTTLAYNGYSSFKNNTEVDQQIVTEINDVNSNSSDEETLDRAVNKDNLFHKNNADDNLVLDNPSSNTVSNTDLITSDDKLLNEADKTNVAHSGTTASNSDKAIIGKDASQKATINNSSSVNQKTSYTTTSGNQPSSDNINRVKNKAIKNADETRFAINQSTKRPYIAINATNSNEHSQNSASNTAQSENKDGQVKTALPSNTDIAATTIPQDSTLTGKSLEDAVAQQEEDENEKDADAIPFKKWNASSVIAPIYSSTMGGSSIDREFADNNKAAGLNLSYGVNVGYNLSSRLSVRTGVHKVNLSYTTNDIVYGVTVQPGDVQLLSVNSYDRNAVSNPGAVSTADLGSSFSQEFLSDNTFTGFQGEISQRLGYLEVPLELKYKLLDRKLSVNVMGGLSALFLTDNSIAVTNNTSKLELGEDDNFNSFNHSANFGLGIDYLFTDQLGITVEPMFKYQLNALKENTADFKPFNVGIYSGITYRF